MAINFPTSLDTLTNPLSTDTLNSPSHSTQHANVNDIAEALEAKVGIDSSTVTTSIDFMLRRMPRLSKTANYTVLAADKGKWITCSGTTAFTLTLTAAATLAADWFCVIENQMTGSAFVNKLNTIDPNAAETIDGVATSVTLPGDIRIIQCDGSNFFSILLQGGYVEIAYSDSPATLTTPSGNWRNALVELWGGGGGGGSGRRGAASSDRRGGSGGGGGAYVPMMLVKSDLGTSNTVTIGAKGTGGAAQTVDSTDGNAGTAGGNTTFGSILTGYGGGAGYLGRAGNSSGGGGGGPMGAGTNGGTGTANGGIPSGTTGAFGGAGGSAGASGAVSGWGGGSGGGPGSSGTAANGGGSWRGGKGGGGGAIIDAANIAGSAGSGGGDAANSGGGGTAGSGGAGGNGTAGPTVNGPGTGGGGGDQNAAGAAYAGGTGGIACGGGGGGASLNGNNSGAGGDGGDGLCRFRYFP